MTFRARLMMLFPALHLAAIWGAFAAFVLYPHASTLAAIPAAAYLFPLLTYHLHQWFCPLREGTFSIAEGYSPWFGTHMIQQGFIAFPALENALRLVPGLFSFWLRLWGARVGHRVYYAPGMEIADRGLLEIGNGAIFGYGVKITAHYISPSRSYGGMKIYIKRVIFEDRCFVGASSRYGPGVVVRAGAMVRATVDHFPDTVIEARAADARGEADTRPEGAA
jgi:hypothetical protein